MTNIKKEDFPSRLRKLMESRDISQADLSKITKITASSISDWLKGKYEAKQDKIDIIATSLNVSPAWLLGYDVPIEKETKKTETPTLRWDEEQLLEYYNNSNHIGKDRIMTVAEEMNELYPKVDRNKILQFFRDNSIPYVAYDGTPLDKLSDEKLHRVYKDVLKDIEDSK